LGNDTYVTDGGDTINEAASAGTDTVQSSVTVTLGANIENLTLTGAAAINGTGNTLANVIIGNGAANTISGGGGGDNLQGGLGNDTYVTDGGDTIVEASSGGTADQVNSSVSITLAANLERLLLTGSTAINGTGNTLDNIITGNAGANTLSGSTGDDSINGGGGNDTLYGGQGNDALAAGAGVDSLVFNTTLNASTNVDTITGFVASEDTIQLDNTTFSFGTYTGVLGEGGFAANSTGTATTIYHRIIYDTTDGRLIYDSNGNAAGGAIHFATLVGAPAISHADFVVI
jgi:Ca2+-binding RTX toxin-like protein